MSSISNSHSMLTFNFWIFPREAALKSVPSWYRCIGREREHGKEKRLQQAETRKKCSMPFFLNNISFITGKTPRLHDLFNSARARLRILVKWWNATRVRNNKTWTTLTGDFSSSLIVLNFSMPPIISGLEAFFRRMLKNLKLMSFWAMSISI